MTVKSIKFIILLALILSIEIKAQQQVTTQKIIQLMEWIDNLYVDSVNMDILTEDVIRKTLQQLDPHSVYVTKEEVRAMNELLEGSFEGIGVSFQRFNDTILIRSTIRGGPSEKVGLKGGDRIITINGENIDGRVITDNDVMRKLRGARGTTVTLEIKRLGYPELLSFRVVRDRIPHHSIVAAYKVTDKIGYIKLSRFAEPSKREFDNALKKLKNEGMTDLILDLTGNGGGYMNIAIQLANEFLERGQMIVYTEGVNSPRREHRANARGEFRTGNLVVMIDEISASSSEIFAGAIQDSNRGVIVGRRSFGKGLIQSQLIFSDSSMLRLTVARYFTPSGRAIQKNYETGAPVRRQTTALEGGIIPDVTAPVDTSYNTPYHRELIRRGHFNDFMVNYVENNRQEILLTYPTFNAFEENFIVTEEILNDLESFAEQRGLPKSPEMFARSKEYFKLWIKGLIVRDFWETSDMYKFINLSDPIFLKAVEVISDLK